MVLQLDGITQVLERLRRSDGAVALREHVRSLADGVPADAFGAVPPPDLDHRDAAEREALASEGYAVLPNVADPALTARLRTTVTALVTAGLPGVFAFVDDEAWSLAELVRARVEALLGARYELLDDGWAWSIPPGRGRGWPPHRGGGLRVFDRRAPELVTVWVALADVGAEQACMHVVPLDEDPGYPGDLDQVDAPLHAVRALPVREGTALAWNANLLHWGGSSARARTPRVSCSFSFGRADAEPPIGLAALDPAEMDAVDRLAAIAGWLGTYGEGQADVAPELLAWARIHQQLAAPRLAARAAPRP